MKKQVSYRRISGAMGILAAAVLSTAAQAATSYAQGYRITEVGWSYPLHFGLALQQVNAINDAGQMVGQQGSHWHGSIGNLRATFGELPAGVCPQWPDTPSCASWDSAINNAGQVAGVQMMGFPTPQQFNGPNTGFHAFLYSGGTSTDLGTLGGTISYSTGINQQGDVSGYSTTAGDAITHATLYTGGSLRDLGTLGGNRSQANAVNDCRQVVGYSTTAGEAATDAFVYRGGALIDLGVGQANAINDSGQIAGADPSGAFLTGSGGSARTRIGGGAAVALNNPGQALVNDGGGFLWDGALLLDVNAIIDPADPLKPQVTLTGVVAINNVGQIVASGTTTADVGGDQFLLSPPPVGQQLATLLSLVTGAGHGHSLSGKVAQAQSYYAVSDTADSCATLADFLAEVSNRHGAGLAPALAGQLAVDARVIMATLACPAPVVDDEADRACRRSRREGEGDRDRKRR